MSSDQQPVLKRSLGVWLVTLYGLGNILGAGIYVLIGEVVSTAGVYAPLAFVLAAVIAAFSAFSYGELSARYPHSAGEAVYVQEAFKLKALSVLVGLMIAIAGMVSSATLARGFVGYFQVFFDAPESLVIVLLVLVLGAVAVWGIKESVRLAAVLTLIEGAGLILIVVVAADHIGSFSELTTELPPFEAKHVHGVLLGAFLAFYAYIGFEDMVNVAEEVRDPQRNLPLGIVAALLISTTLYLLVVVASLASVGVEQLSASQAPLAVVFEHSTGRAPWVISMIGALAVINGALVQIIMAARILYGMARRKWLPPLFARIHPRTQTPIPATLFVAATIAVLALWFPLVALAKSTSYLVLSVFVLVNLALLQLKRQVPQVEGVKPVARWIPLAGLICTAGLIAAQVLIG